MPKSDWGLARAWRGPGARAWRAGLVPGRQSHRSALALAIHGGDGQVAAHGSSIAALQSSLTTGLSNKADQLAFDVLEGVVATKSTPDGVDLQLQHHGGHERLHRLGQQRHAGHGGHSLDIAARITPLEVDTKVANALLGAVTAAALASKQGRLHLGAAGLQGGRQRPDSLRPAVGRGHFALLLP